MMAIYAEQFSVGGEGSSETAIAVFSNEFVEKNVDGLVILLARMREKAGDGTEFSLGPYYPIEAIDEPLGDIWNGFLEALKLPSEPLLPVDIPK